MNDYFDYLDRLSLEGLKIESTTISRTPENKQILLRILKLIAGKLKTSKSTVLANFNSDKYELGRYLSASQDYSSKNY